MYKLNQNKKAHKQNEVKWKTCGENNGTKRKITLLL